ncbi:hypothetical protein EK21DRAFT_119395 [Setomelanomma holmii]|uniref:Uncharacterized protein n=1 Tax=Setomelanomma holmii TaxID=210430 RepID=A0A9P4GVK0_9PLEO|nr:hypothetical protein EK21DRAFT_119395 [Setomelanomma holmii]
MILQLSLEASTSSRQPEASSASTEPAPAVAQCLEVVAEGTNPTVDIVAVHGLHRHLEKTWAAGNGGNWLRDLLSDDLPNARATFLLAFCAAADGIFEQRCRMLVQSLEGLSLALATTGAYLYQVSTTFADYLRLYNASWPRLQQKAPEQLSYEDRAPYSTHIEKAWGLEHSTVNNLDNLYCKLDRLDEAEKMFQCT